MALVPIGAVVALVVMTLVWIVSAWRRNASYVDRAWGPVVAVVGWSYLVAAEETSARALVVAGVVTAWGVRLGVHLTASGWGRGEEWRHRAARDRHPRGFAVRSLLALFWPQGLAAVAVSLPLLAVALDERGARLHPLDVAGVVLSLAGVTIEAAADAQLRRHRARAAGGIMADGLWRYSRHPNYFGDAVMWWGLGLVGVAAGHRWALLGPLGMTCVLVFGSGVRSMDRHMRETRGARYADYAARTSAFVPLPPRSRHDAHVPAGAMLLLRWKKLSGSHAAFSARSRPRRLP